MFQPIWLPRWCLSKSSTSNLTTRTSPLGRTMTQAGAWKEYTTRSQIQRVRHLCNLLRGYSHRRLSLSCWARSTTTRQLGSLVQRHFRSQSGSTAVWSEKELFQCQAVKAGRKTLTWMLLTNAYGLSTLWIGGPFLRKESPPGCWLTIGSRQKRQWWKTDTPWTG